MVKVNLAQAQVLKLIVNMRFQIIIVLFSFFSINKCSNIDVCSETYYSLFLNCLTDGQFFNKDISKVDFIVYIKAELNENSELRITKHVGGLSNDLKSLIEEAINCSSFELESMETIEFVLSNSYNYGNTDTIVSVFDRQNNREKFRFDNNISSDICDFYTTSGAPVR